MTATIERLYDALMVALWRVRSFVCLLLAVSTAIGGVAPARACACAEPAKTPSTPVRERAVTPQSAAKACCQPNAKKRSCCAPTSARNAAKASCCDGVPLGQTGKAPTASTPTDSTGCHCLRCDCDTPNVPPTPAPTPTVPDLGDHLAGVPVLPVLIPGAPAVVSRPARSTPASPPTDLVISLSRLTC